MVLEDLHWADDALLAFVRHLGEEARGVPLLVVATARPSCSTATRTRTGRRPSRSPPCRTPTPPA
jgi:predicted ATPase